MVKKNSSIVQIKYSADFLVKQKCTKLQAWIKDFAVLCPCENHKCWNNVNITSNNTGFKFKIWNSQLYMNVYKKNLSLFVCLTWLLNLTMDSL